jgi:hypothetical protein
MPMSPIVFAGTWLLFCLALLLAVGTLAQAFQERNSDPIERAFYATMGAASSTLAIAFGYRVYRNFRRHNR